MGTQKTVIGWYVFMEWLLFPTFSQNALLLMAFLSMLSYHSKPVTSILLPFISSAHVMVNEVHLS